MTNYAISTVVGTNPGLYVVNAETNAIVSGPYKNEESAKRRIRDLKRKEAEAIAGVPTVTPEVAKLAEVAATTIAPALPDAAKLAASSAYGKSNAIAPILDGKPIVRMSHSPFGTTPAGVYPAISKSERRKRWNYA